MLIPVYNGEKTLRRAVDSVLNQSFRDFELILCDDKSTDGSLELMREYACADPRVRIIEHAQNLGRSAAHCSLNRAASRPYSICVDADDEIAPDFLALGAEMLNQEPFDVMEFPCELRFSDGGSRFAVKDDEIQRSGNMLMKYLKDCMSMWWSRIYRTEILRNTEPLTRENFLADDCFFMAPLYYQVKSYRYVRTDRPMYIYYADTGAWSNIMRNMTPEKFDLVCRTRYETIKLNAKFYRRHGFGNEYEEEMLRLYALNDLVVLLEADPEWRRQGIEIFRKWFLKDGNLLNDGSVSAPQFAAFYNARLNKLESSPGKPEKYKWNI